LPAPSAAPTPSTSGEPSDDPIAALAVKAQEEGTLTTIALPRDSCDNGKAIDTFKAKYGLAVNEQDPLASSGEVVDAIDANKDNPGPHAPDVIHVGLSFGPSAQAAGLLAPYRVATWDTIPEEAKDSGGYWWGDYYGVISFEVNRAVASSVPEDWPDLLGPEYEGQVALAGDPRTSDLAIRSVFAASLANGGSLDDPLPGLEFFRELYDAGNLLPRVATATTVAAGETPIAIRWTYDALSNRDTTIAAGGPEIAVVVPKSGRLAGIFLQGISAYAPHPNAAKLWQEFLFSDEGQNIWLKGYCHPIRYENLVETDAVPQEQLDKLPDVEGAVFPSLDQLNAASALITSQWDSVVGANIQ
jgi:putative spermidine/putrescine transport system substrate-binding protein